MAPASPVSVAAPALRGAHAAMLSDLMGTPRSGLPHRLVARSGRPLDVLPFLDAILADDDMAAASPAPRTA
ncbi:hypothetical protein SPRG_10162 [Saprolegnia parasitica CBS 223.65]|uniref:Uncharacterized protein n=1 Tax=Saprolegnia parasitica (strain CBS 223.65) TaxID=695850 RepID=A0A067C654_SAPPC|nr:hypothetical protein SPRG_10162 [Saprolegnia parasitica CBS 223.65]KDO24630.1 hypothetical protein SPRG_10162 [Saprolegnia parasitica CBS 223.65]|eukprot:XP_012204698.1 hypothetical protein SPRG_10162 [Saprolegnia parasitica CBS 223.65]